MDDVIVIGGGAAGMMAAIMAAERYETVTILEKNEKLGKKLFITGKGRCNVTNASDVEEHLSKNISNPKFLYSAFYTLDSYSFLDYLHTWGLETKVERGNRAFPKSDKSSDVIKTFERQLSAKGIKVYLNYNALKIRQIDEGFEIIGENKPEMKCKKIIIATGGLSYPGTGSTGDGYRFAKEYDHKIIEQAPGLVPFEIKESLCKTLQGLALRNVNVKIKNNKKVYYEGFGEMLFTHFGISGPLVISGSSFIPKNNCRGIKVVVDMKPALTEEELDRRILKDFSENDKKDIINGLDQLLPKKMIPIVVEKSEINPRKKIHQIKKEERKNLVDAIKKFTLTVIGTRSYREAIITRGGVSVKDINPNTMESKKVKDMYFVGEVLDLDALTGGYNLQIAFSTGYLAGISV